MTIATPARFESLANIRLCAGIYSPTGANIPPIEVICQTVIVNGTAYAWIDGVSETNPVLLPVESLNNFKNFGTLQSYLQDDRHAELDTEFDSLGELCLAQKASATLMVRACEIMHAEGLSAEDALSVARQWGELINELDQAERAAYSVVSGADTTAAI